MKTSDNITSLQQWLRLSPWFFAIGFVFWFGSLTLFGINMDQGYAFFREDQRIWLSQGRWAIFFLAQYIHPQPVLAYFPHLIFVLCATLAYPLLLSALQIRTEFKVAALLAYPVLIAHPLWYFILEFTANTLPTGLGLLATLAAVWLFAGLIQKRLPLHPVINIGLQIILLSTALGLYQSLIFIAAIFYLAVLLRYYTQNPPHLKALLLSALILVGSLIFNGLLLELLYVIYNTSDDYIGSNLHLSKIIDNSAQTFRYTRRFIRAIYLGSDQVYSTRFIGSALIIGLALLYLVFVQSKAIYRKLYQINQQHHVLSLVTLVGLALGLALVFITALIPQVLAGGVYYMPYRTLIAASAPVWLATIYLLIQAQSHAKPWRYTVLAVVLLSLVQILHIHARFNSGTALLKHYDRQLASAIYNRAVEIIPNFSVQTPTLFDLGGGINYVSLYGSPSTSLMTDSFFGKKYDVPIRVGNFLRTQGLLGLEPVNLHQHAELQPLYETMPAWPASGSMRMHEGILLIKLGD